MLGHWPVRPCCRRALDVSVLGYLIRASVWSLSLLNTLVAWQEASQQAVRYEIEHEEDRGALLA